MKNPWDWDENDLQQLIKDGAKESLDLDFKQSDALQNSDGKKNDISKDVSAFANSAGGVIIYGVIEDGHVATGIDHGVDPKIITKEWLEQVISSRIHQKIDGIRINQIELQKTNKGNVAYVVYTPSSTRAPHQASDKRFYKRHNFECVPMEEYEIRDVARRLETPDLRIDFVLPTPDLVFKDENQESEPVALYASITNDAIEPANYAVIRLYFDKRLKISNAQGLDLSEDARLLLGNEDFQINLLSKNWGIPGSLPIFNTAFNITGSPIELKINVKDRFQEKSYLLGYEILSPKMPLKQQFRILTLRTANLYLSDNSFSANELVANFKQLVK